MRRKAVLLVLTIWCLVAAGCGDPTRTTRQTVVLRVVDSATGKPIVGATVRIRYEHDIRVAASADPRRPPDPARTEREFWERLPSCITDGNGRADAVTELTMIDATSGPKLPHTSDAITGYPYLVKVNAVEVPEEILKVLMKPGEVVKGPLFTVTVIEIQEPVYIVAK
jgi:hypothetical protein